MAVEKLPVDVWERVGSGWEWRGQIGGYTSFSAEPRWRSPGAWSIQMRYTTEAELLVEQRAITFDLRGERFTGLVEKVAPSKGEDRVPMLEVSGRGALALLDDTVCYPDPTAGASAQLVTHYRATGPAETVLRTLILAQHVTRKGESLTIPASTGRGDTVTVNLFFDNLLEVVRKQARVGGLGLKMGLENTTSSTRAQMVLRFLEGGDKSAWVTLNPNSGLLRSWRSEDGIPGATRAVVLASIRDTPVTIASVDATANSLNVTGGHGLKTGSQIRFRGGGTMPTPLDDGTAYYAIRVDSNTFKVAKSRAKALDGTAIDLTAAGSGTIKVTRVDRTIREVVHTPGETRWGRKREMVVDARDEDTDDETVLTKRGDEALDEVEDQSSFNLEAVDVEGMRLYGHYTIGDLLTVKLTGGVASVQRLTGATITFDSGGLKVALLPGNPDARDPAFRTHAILRSFNRRIRNLEQQED
jgi:hypothetical protein